ncbi:ABC transporter ATP-binding protein [Acetobacterium carbinolicum]|uniref:ABC transporter ATP-binding protein n=1 Tax=Acetobacterium carbinolicum TaxID=52690 RepID=UPI0039C9B952
MFKTLKTILRWTGKYKKTMYIGFVCSFFATIFKIIPLMLGAYSVHYIILDAKGEAPLPEHLALYMALGIGLAIVLNAIFNYLRFSTLDITGYKATADERIEVGNMLKRVPLGYFEQHKTGDITATISSELTLLEGVGMKSVNAIVEGYITTAAILICLAFFNPVTALIGLLGVCVSFIFLNMVSKLGKRVVPQVHKAHEDMTRSVIEYLHGLSQIKSYGNEGEALSSIRKAFRDSRDTNIKAEISYAPIDALYGLSLKLAAGGIIFVVSLLTIDGGMSLLYSVMMLMFTFSIFASIEGAGGSIHMLNIIESNIGKLNNLKQSAFIDEDGKNIALTDYSVEFEKVSFAYDSTEVVKNVSFKIPENSMTAIVGPSGSGKTTLCNLIARFYDVKSGAVKIGGHNVRAFTCDSLLKNISMVFQTVYLFHDTIANNIKLGNPAATEEQVLSAAKKARCHEFISEFPAGYETIVGESGSTLSGGEKQRISIARAILKDSPIVMLDEATASIDPENEHFIQGAINELTKGKTVITIAHKLSTIENADNIIVMKDGRVLQQGKHEELVKTDGVYKKFIEIRKTAEGWSI